jgi:hypothetical protein
MSNLDELRPALLRECENAGSSRGLARLCLFLALAAGSWVAVPLHGFVLGEVAPLPVVTIIGPADPTLEGHRAVIRLHRTTTVGDLQVRLRTGGNAAKGSDYVLSGLEALDGDALAVTIGDGRPSALLIVDVVDDIHAEADESLLVQVQEALTYEIHETEREAVVRIPSNDVVVINTNDAGEGSLRQAILNANSFPGPDTIRFDAEVGPFTTPQTILPNTELPELSTEIFLEGRIPGRLWVPHGVTISGDRRRRVLRVGERAQVTVSAVTIADGRADVGAGILNRGTLVLRDATLLDNVADTTGGGVANLGGTITVVNSTFASNTAGRAGGGLASEGGTATVTNCSFSHNGAPTGSGLFSNGEMLLRNTILANSTGGPDCVARQPVKPASTHNLIESNEGCGEPITTANPLLTALGSYNGPTPTFALRSGSPAINSGDNASALDEFGTSLEWDQRGNGDPRFVAGFTDIGSFEHQAFPDLTVDVAEDVDLRGCTRVGIGDCSLRGAIHLANATPKPDTIRFDRRVFSSSPTLSLTYPLPLLSTDMVFDASDAGGLTVSASFSPPLFRAAPGIDVELIGVTVGASDAHPATEDP